MTKKSPFSIKTQQMILRAIRTGEYENKRIYWNHGMCAAISDAWEYPYSQINTARDEIQFAVADITELDYIFLHTALKHKLGFLPTHDYFELWYLSRCVDALELEVGNTGAMR